MVKKLEITVAEDFDTGCLVLRVVDYSNRPKVAWWWHHGDLDHTPVDEGQLIPRTTLIDDRDGRGVSLTRYVKDLVRAGVLA